MERKMIVTILLIINIKLRSYKMTDVQEYELKLAVCHHTSLKTDQLVEFLENQSNQFLTNDLPNSLTQDHFLTIFQPISKQAQDDQYSQYVGMILLYSSGSQDSFNFMKKNIPDSQFLSDMFLIIVQMDNSDKQTNAIGDEGQKMCAKMGYQFVRLSLYNSQDLVSVLHKNLYQLIENYYYPNQEQKPSKKNYDSQYMFHYAEPNQNQSNHTGLVKKTNGRILATREQKKSIQKLLDKASQMRQSRQQQVTTEQRQIDQSIENVEKVLSNINRNIKQKINSQWYTSLNHTLYSPLQKNSTSFAKIKLTQEFVEQDDEIPFQYLGTPHQKSVKLGQSKGIGTMRSVPARSALINKFIAKHKKLEPLMKLVLAVGDVNFFVFQSVIVEIQVFEDSTYQELAAIAIKKFAITDTPHNNHLMKGIISQRIQDFIKQLSRAVKTTEKQLIDERSFLRSPNYSQFQSLRSQY